MEKEWDVGELLGVSTSYWKGCTLQAGVRLAIFTHIGDDKLPSEQIAHASEADLPAMELLLNALAGIGLLVKEGRLYKNTMFSAKFLAQQSPQYMGHIILHHHHLVDGWAQLDQAVITGSPIEKRSYGEELERKSFIMGMFNLAMGLAPQIATLFDFTDRKKLLDLGGGPGTYAIEFCQRNPALHATIYDRHTTRPFAEKTAKKFGMENRIDFIGGDFTTDPIGGGPYDVAWLSHILHSNSLKQCEKIVADTISQLAPGGLLLIHDFILDNSMDRPEFAALFSLNMLINNGVGRSYSLAEIEDMMIKSGVKDIEHRTFDSPNGSSILLGVV